MFWTICILWTISFIVVSYLPVEWDRLWSFLLWLFFGGPILWATLVAAAVHVDWLEYRSRQQYWRAPNHVPYWQKRYKMGFRVCDPESAVAIIFREKKNLDRRPNLW